MLQLPTNFRSSYFITCIIAALPLNCGNMQCITEDKNSLSGEHHSVEDFDIDYKRFIKAVILGCSLLAFSRHH
jgi:hypothetical protein